MIDSRQGEGKRIICTVTNDLTYDQRMQRICTVLSQAGYEVMLIGREKKDSMPLQVAPYQQYRVKCWFEKGKLFYLEYNLRLFWLLMFQRFDIVNAIDLDTIIPCYLASLLKGAKRVFDAHEWFPEVPEVVRRKPIQCIWRLVERIFVPRYHLVYTVSESLAEIFSGMYKIPVACIRNVPYLSDAPEVDLSCRVSPQYLLYQGALNEGRGLEELILAMQFIDHKLILAGRGDIEDLLRKMVNDKKLQGRVIFKGWVEPSALKLLTRQAFLGFNLLDKKSLSYYYSLANKFFDYIHAGVPVVCIDFPEYRKVNQQFRVAALIDRLDPLKIAGIVNELTINESLYRELKENCLKAREVFCWETESEKLLQLYRKL